METATLKFPETLAEFSPDELVRISATWEEYLDLAENALYSVQYLNGEVITSQASRSHESLVMVIGRLLSNYFLDKEEYDVLSSNVSIMIPDRIGDFNADVSVVKEPVKYGLTSNGNVSTMRIENPEIVVEVLSNSTRKFDLNEKLDYYKLIPSLQHILLVDQHRLWVSAYSRTNRPDEWLNHDYRTLDATVRLGELEMPVAAIYRKVNFDA